MNRMFRLLPFALGAILLAAGVSVVTCRGSGAAEYSLPSAREESYDNSYDKEAARSAPAPETMSEVPTEADETAAGAANLPAAEPEPQAQERKRVYSGYAELLVDDLEETKADVQALAEAEGGYVEEAYGESIVIRVPAGRFSEILEEILLMGEVLDSWEETVDVTEYFSDLETRLRIARETRERLYVLLERTEDPEERVKILREIRRLTEEIEQISLRFEHLKELISYSRITVTLHSKVDYFSADDREIPFPWIAELHPLYPSIFEFKGMDKPSGLPEDFAVFRKEDYFSAENPDGVRLRIGTVGNRPRGDLTFWRDALEFHLSPLYASAGPAPEEAGGGPEGFKGVLFTSKDREPFFYLVGVYVDGRRVHVAEVFFPDKASLDKVYDDILKVLMSGGAS